METVFFDIDTQVDFIDSNGALYVPGSKEIAPNIRHLLEYAGEHRITTISPMCAHVVNDPEFQQFPPHCVEGSPGQRRYFDELPKLRRHVWEAEATVREADIDIVSGDHYVVKKRSFPMFSNPWMKALAKRGRFRGMDAVAFGVATDVCVRVDVLDLCRVGARVRLVRDAIAGIRVDDTERALRQMTGAGVRLVRTGEIVGEGTR